MTDEQIRLLLNLGSDEARLLLDSGERALYKRIQTKMVKLVRDYDVHLSLNCLQFMYCENRLFKNTGPEIKARSVFLNHNSRD